LKREPPFLNVHRTGPEHRLPLFPPSPRDPLAVAQPQWRRHAAIAAVGLAIAVRLAAVMAFPSEPIADAADYHGLAVRLAGGSGYVNEDGAPTAVRPPGYPAFLAIVYSLLGPEPRNAYLVQAALGGLTVAILLWLGSQAVGYAEALIAGFLAAVYPGLVWLPRVLLSENLALPLLLCSLCAAARLLSTNQSSWALVTGATLALAVLTRASSAFLVVLLLLGLLISFAKQAGLRRAVVITLMTILPLSVGLLPWAYRNHRLFGRGPVLTTEGGITLYTSYWPPRAGIKPIWGNVPGGEDPTVAAAGQLRNEAAVSAELAAVTIKRLVSEPGLFFSLWPEKLMWSVAPFDWEWFPRRAGQTRSLNSGYLLLLVPAVIGLRRLWTRPQKGQWLLWLLPAAVFVQTLVFYGGPRLRLPAESSLLILAAVGIVHLHHEANLRRWWSRRHHPADASVRL
jgi:4-amino-4-deoxy-L-arabinose transferase-like glycosyltransferase